MSMQSNMMSGAFSLDSANLSRSAVNTVRTTLGIAGVVALIVGILITFWPKGAALGITVIVGIYLLVAGLAYLGLGIFSRGISGGARAIDLILGVLFVIGGIIAFSNLAATTVVLAVLLGILIGI